MKKTLFIVGSLIVVGFLALFIFLVIAVKDNPVAIVAKSTNSNSDNQYYLNSDRVGNNKGFCKIYRNGTWDIELRQGTQKQTAKIQQLFGFRMNIGKPRGDDLGLQVISANADQRLRQEYNCNL